MGICRGDFPTYIGTSIKSSEEELERLKKLGLPIFFYDDCIEGWNSNNVWCGECANRNCAKCPSKDVKED